MAAAAAGTAGTGTAARKPPAAKPTGTTVSGATPAADPGTKSLQAHLTTITEVEVMDPQGVYDFLESLRALTSSLAFFAHSAGAQLSRAARKGAKDSADGRLTMKQRAELMLTLKRMGRRIESNLGEDLLAAASESVKIYGLLEDFLENVESDNVARPHRSNRGGFSLGGR